MRQPQILASGSEAFERLRKLIQQGPSAWVPVCHLFEDWPFDPDGYTIGLDYAQELLEAWTDADRKAPKRWAETFVQTTTRQTTGHLPTAWMLVRTLNIGAGRTGWKRSSDESRWLFESPRMENITILRIHNAQDRDVEVLSQTPRLRGLIELELSGSLSDQAAKTLEQATDLGALKSLTIRSKGISTAAGEALRRSLTSLETLILP